MTAQAAIKDGDAGIADRRRWMGVLARAGREELEEAWTALPSKPAHRFMRAPEIGLVMVQARAGGSGNPFNLGEMTVTRCALRLDSGVVGFGYVQGRDKRRAELAAAFDALLQTPETRDEVLRGVVEKLAAAQAERRALRSRKAASTKVEFFTMVRGDNPR
ncbi:MAG: phosphonate C-P lyase system protein PhnG [Rhizobiales bacterium 65-9]|nr:phosphonate C-P lyase system protein PhnG [Hyphomicrobiales bacterium]OJY40162.1 MAG: phosphonate C-P lyase system protein PhnG [Rhizobiales bacterium 65-9]